MSSHTIFITLALCVGAAAFALMRFVKAPKAELSAGEATPDEAPVATTQRDRACAFVEELEREFGSTVRFDELVDGSFFMILRDADEFSYLGGIFTGLSSSIHFFITPFCPQPLCDAMKALAAKEAGIQVTEYEAIVTEMTKNIEIAQKLQKNLGCIYLRNKTYGVCLSDKRGLMSDFCGYISAGSHVMVSPVVVKIFPNCPEPVRSMMRALEDPPIVVVNEEPMDQKAAAYEGVTEE